MLNFYIISFILSLLCLLLQKYNRKQYQFLNLVLFFFAVIFMINASDEVGDLYNYKNAYMKVCESGEFANADLGYGVLMFIGSKAGLSFFQFKTFIVFLSVILIYMTIHRYTNYSCFFLLFYLMHSIFLDGWQLRNFLAISIVIFAIPWLCKEKNSIIIYSLLVILASSIHFMAIVYLTFIWIRLDEKLKKWILRLMPIVLLFILYYSINTNIISEVIRFVSNFTNDATANKLEFYSTQRSRLGFLAPFLIYFSYIIFIKFVSKYLIEDTFVSIKKSNVKNFVIRQKIIILDNRSVLKFIEQINMLGVIFLPFNVVSLVFYRWVRNICLLDLIYFSICYDAAKSKKSRFIIFFGVLILIFLWQIFDFKIYQGIFLDEAYFYK